MASNPIVDKKDQRIGIISALSVLLAIFIYLKFAYFLMADPAPKDYPVLAELSLPTEISLKEMKIEGGGSGTPSNDPVVSEPQQQTEKIATNAESKTDINTGESNKTNSPNSDNTASTTTKGNNPFGSGGSGGGNNGGNGKGFGDDDGDGKGPGKGEGIGPRETRLRLSDVASVSDAIGGRIYLNVTINAEGNVVKVVNLNKTTITNQLIINQVMSNVKGTVKYNKMPGTTPQTQQLVVNVSEE